ncbi:helix-turn-helix domain-containing protein [Acidithiobacillus caldus]
MGALDKWLQEARCEDVYWVEKAKLDFAFSLEAQRRRAGMSPSAIAKVLGVTRAYISKAFRGDVNFTIETMVKLARATGGQLSVGVIPKSQAVEWAIPAANFGVRHQAAPAANSVSIVATQDELRDGTSVAA